MSTAGAAQASAALIGLAETCRDGELGFHAAAAGFEEPTLRQLCETYADQRAGFRRELLEELAGLGAAPASAGLAPGGSEDAGHLGAGQVGPVTLAELARRDADAESAYRNALGRGLPGHATGTVERQHEQVLDALKHLTLLEQTLPPDA